MNGRVGLYFDCLKRMNLRQLYFLVRNRLIRSRIDRWTRRKGFARYYRHTEVDNSYWVLLRSKLNGVVCSPLVDVETSKRAGFTEGARSEYLHVLEELILSIRDDASCCLTFEIYWHCKDATEDDRNIRRFYLFNRIFQRNPSGGVYAVKLLTAWMHIEPNLPRYALDPFDCAVRLINWAQILAEYAELIGSDSWLSNRCIGSMIAQREYLRTNIEHEIPGNHVLVELYSLWLTNVVLEDPNVVSKANAEIEQELKSELLRQFSDGAFHAEQSTHYHIQSTIIGMIWLHGLKSLGRPIDPDLEATLRTASEYATMLCFPDGFIPMCGDNCYSVMTANSQEDIGLLHRLTSELFRSQLPLRVCETKLRMGKSYFFFRNRRLTMLIDIGPIGYHPNPGHGHSDLLSFVLAADDSTVLIDPGTMTYERSQEALLYKGSLSHNTLSIDGHDQAQLWDRFRWSRLPESQPIRTIRADDGLVLTAEYFGFRHIGGFVHSRTFHATNDELILHDQVKGSGAHDLIFSFIFHPDWNPEVVGDCVYLTKKNGKEIVEIATQAACDRIVEPIRIFPVYNESVLSQKLTLVYRASLLPHVSHTFIRLRAAQQSEHC